MSSVLIPAAVAQRYSSWTVTLVYEGVSSVRTWRLERSGEAVRFLKAAAHGDAAQMLKAEIERMTWAERFLPVPHIIESGEENGVAWMVTAGLSGLDATHPELQRDPEALVGTLARGLREFHRAPVPKCPFDFTVDVAIETARMRAASGKILPETDFHSEHSHLDVDSALEELERLRPETEELVVCHGDYCFPNVLIQGGDVTGYLDLGELGVADRWWDLAVATWSTTWNLGPGYEELFLESYGVPLDERKSSFYRLLYDLVS